MFWDRAEKNIPKSLTFSVKSEEKVILLYIENIENNVATIPIDNISLYLLFFTLTKKVLANSEDNIVALKKSMLARIIIGAKEYGLFPNPINKPKIIPIDTWNIPTNADICIGDISALLIYLLLGPKSFIWTFFEYLNIKIANKIHNIG